MNKKKNKVREIERTKIERDWKKSGHAEATREKRREVGAHALERAASLAPLTSVFELACCSWRLSVCIVCVICC